MYADYLAALARLEMLGDYWAVQGLEIICQRRSELGMSEFDRADDRCHR